MQRYPTWPAGQPVAPAAPLVLLFERNDAIAVPLITQVRTAGYDIRVARIPVELFDIMQREPIALILIDLGNAAANRREFWVGLDTQRRGKAMQLLTFRYVVTGETGMMEDGVRVARADVEVISAQGFGPLIDAIRARVPGAQPVMPWDGPPAPNLSQPLRSPGPGQGMMNSPSAPAGGPSAGGSSSNGGGPPASPFAQPYSDNPFKRRGPTTPPPLGASYPQGANNAAQAPPQPPASNGSSAWSPPPLGGFAAPLPPRPMPASMPFDGFAPGGAAAGPSANGRGLGADPQAAAARIEDAWNPPARHDAPPPARGVAYRGYDDAPLAPDDPRIEDATSPVPAVAYVDAQSANRNERALSTILMDSAVISPQRLDALRAIQVTLNQVGMGFSLAELAMLFRFLTPDQLLAAYLVSRGLVTAEQIASLGRIKQELLATGKDYDLEALLAMFNILPADQVRLLRMELG